MLAPAAQQPPGSPVGGFEHGRRLRAGQGRAEAADYGGRVRRWCPGRVRGSNDRLRSRGVPASLGLAGEEQHPRRPVGRRRPDRYRQRRVARRLPAQRCDAWLAERRRARAAGRALPQQSRPDLHRRHRTRRRRERAVGLRRGSRRLRQRRLDRPLRHQSRARTACIATTTTARSPTSPNAWASRLQAGRPERASATTTTTAASTCSWPATSTSMPSAARQPPRCRALLLSRRAGDVRPARVAGRAGPAVPQQRRRHFIDVSAQAGVGDTAGYYGFASALIDVDDDGNLDLMVINDSTPNYLYLNKGDGTFEDVGFAVRLRAERGRARAGGHGPRDRRLRQRRPHRPVHHQLLRRLQHAAPQRRRRRRSPTSPVRPGCASRPIPFLGWGTGFLDFDNDGWQDLFVANGHVYPQVDRYDWGMTWAQRPLLFRNRDGKRFEQVPAATGIRSRRGCPRAARHSAIWITTAASTSCSTTTTTAPDPAQERRHGRALALDRVEDRGPQVRAMRLARSCARRPDGGDSGGDVVSGAELLLAIRPGASISALARRPSSSALSSAGLTARVRRSALRGLIATSG